MVMSKLQLKNDKLESYNTKIEMLIALQASGKVTLHFTIYSQPNQKPNSALHC